MDIVMQMFIDALIEKDDWRRLIICKVLSTKQEVKIKELEQLCKCTNKTVFSDINIINSDCYIWNGIEIFKKRPGVIYIENNDAILINLRIRNCIVESNLFKLLNQIVAGEEINLTKFKKSNFVSDSPVYKGLRKLNVFLTQFNLKIDQFKLVGDEYKARVFLFHLYWTIFGGYNWPFEKVNKKIYSKEIYILETHFSRPFTWLENEKIYFWLAINDMRNKESSIKDGRYYWKNFDISSQNSSNKIVEADNDNFVDLYEINILVIQFLLCDENNLKVGCLGLDNFTDSLSVISNRVIKRLCGKKNSEYKMRKTKVLQDSLIKFIHYERLGEAYTRLALKEERDYQNIKITEYPELAPCSPSQALQIIQIIETIGIFSEKNFSIFIGSKYGDTEMIKIKYLLEYYSPRNYKYLSLWGNEKCATGVIITDVYTYPEKSNCLKVQLPYPFDKNNAILIIEKVEKYFMSGL